MVRIVSADEILASDALDHATGRLIRLFARDPEQRERPGLMTQNLLRGQRERLVGQGLPD